MELCYWELKAPQIGCWCILPWGRLRVFLGDSLGEGFELGIGIRLGCRLESYRKEPEKVEIGGTL